MRYNKLCNKQFKSSVIISALSILVYFITVLISYGIFEYDNTELPFWTLVICLSFMFFNNIRIALKYKSCYINENWIDDAYYTVIYIIGIPFNALLFLWCVIGGIVNLIKSIISG